MKKSILKRIITALLLLADLSLLSAQISFDSEADSFGVKRHILQNDMEVFVKEDFSSALVRVELSVKAGFSSQTPKTAGFLPLYARILFNGGVCPLESSSCNSDSATYVFETAPSALEKTLNFISKQLQSPSFPDSTLRKEYESMKNEVTEYSESTTGFVNSAIDSCIFYEEPWKQDSGIYPSLFSKSQISEVRSELQKISRTYYVPQNTALFISGSISSDNASRLAEKYFASWKKGTGHAEAEAAKLTDRQKSKKFVLLESGFSDELTQIIVQYTGMSINQTDILASCFTDITSPYKNSVLGNDLLAVRGQTYLTAASAVKGKKSRLILQAIMEKPYSLSAKAENRKKKATVTEQAEAFLAETKKSAVLEEKEFIRAKSTVDSKYRSQTGNSGMLMAYLAEIWASGLERRPLAEETLQSLTETAASEEPYVFILVNPSVYQAQKKSFDKAGYSAITKDNAYWYKNDDSVKKALADSQKNKGSVSSEQISSASAGDYYESNAPLFSSYTLKNKIPVVLKKNPGKSSAVISISINGGELTSPTEERFLRTILINSFAQNIQERINMLRAQNKFNGDTSLKAWTEETVSYITINCINSDISAALSAVSEAILLGEVTPVNADSLVYEQKMQWNQKSAYLDYQMKCAALSALYSGTKFEKLFDASSSILRKTTYRTFSLDYMQLLDSSLYGIVISGDISEKETLDSLEKTMGILKQQTKAVKEKGETPEVTRTVRKVKLRHTFTTDIPAELAGPAPEVLVPTKEFTDPVQYWLASPVESKDEAVFNALLFELGNMVQEKLKGESTCTAVPATPVIKAACIQCDGILHTALFKKAYDSSVKELLDLLSASNKDEIQKIKETWILRVMGRTSDEEGTASLIQEGILGGNPKQYLEDYRAVENADGKKLHSIAEKYFSQEPVYEIYSADSKN